MKRNWSLALLALALVFGMAVVGCDNGSTDNILPQTVKYEGTDAVGNAYILTVTEQAKRAVYIPLKGDSYVLIITINGQEKKSSGTITIVTADGTLTLQPSVAGSVTFSITISGEKISSVTGEIAVEGGEVITPNFSNGNEPGGDDDVIIDGWKWGTYSDSGQEGGTSTITMTRGTGNDNKKLTFTGNVKNITGQSYGYSGWGAVPNAENLAALKNASSISFKCKGNVDICRVDVRTSNITDTGDHYRTTFEFSETERTIIISYNDLYQPAWAKPVEFDKNLITHLIFEFGVGGRGEGPFTITIWDLKAGGSTSGGNENGGSSGGETFTSISAMAAWLADQPANTVDEPYTVKLNVADLGGKYYESGSAGYALKANNAKYVNLDLSGSTIIGIVDNAFNGCNSLARVTIPDSVESIGQSAFSDCTSLASVTIGNGLTSIGIFAFSGCTSLTGIIIPDSITSIGGYAFNRCTSLTSVNIGSGVTSIEVGSFNRCTSLTAINVDADNTAYSSQDGVLYEKDGLLTLIKYPAGKTDSTFTIPEGVFKIMGGINDIGGAFTGCTSLTSVTIPKSLDDIIGNNPFAGCTSLTAITVDADNDRYRDIDGVLYDRGRLGGVTLITYPAGKTGDFAIIPNFGSITGDNQNLVGIGSYAFSDCVGLTGITISDRITAILEGAFSGCTGLTSVTIPANVTRVYSKAFSGCTNLASVTFERADTSLTSSLGSASFDGDLPSKYGGGGMGTYTTTAPVSSGSVWTKQ